MKKITYPEYIPDWSGSRSRQYPTEKQLLKANPKLINMSEEERKTLQRHHIDLDRMNGNAHNIDMLDDDTHKAVHCQERSLSSALIKEGVLEYHREDPHYSIKDLHVRDILKGKVKPLTEAIEPTELW
jgi:hypothetical protein